MWYGYAADLGCDSRFHLKEGNQVSKKQCLIGNARCSGESLLDIGHRLHDCGCDYLGDHLKTGHLWSLQNRPLWMA